MECIPSCITEYKYLSDDEKECLKVCPVGKYYVEEAEQKCLNACPGSHPFHSKNDFKCLKIEQCPDKFIDYQNKLCVTSCEGFKYQYEEKDNDNNILYTVCLNDCSIYHKYLTPNNKCVDTCEENDFLILDTDFKCKCVNLYYKDISSSEIVCLESSKACTDTESNTILKYNTQECLNICLDVLTLNSEKCFKEEEQLCEANKESIELISSSQGQKQCNCIYKYYINNESGLKICLSSEEQCPTGYEYYNPVTKQCLNDCGDLKTFHKICLNACPEGASSSSPGECECPENKNWYQISQYNFKCLPGTCIDSHPFLIEETKQCVSKCKNTEYPLLVNNKCYSSCDTFGNTRAVNIDTFRSEYEFASETCQCNTLWYYDEIRKANVCPSGPKTSCKDFEGYNFNYKVKKTDQCVIACPNDYPYSFNDECFYSCSSANTDYNLDIKQNGNSKVCICNNLWKFETEGDITKIVCLPGLECPTNYLEIFDTRECLEYEDNNKICPRDSPLEFNDICYKENSCPTNSHYEQNNAGKCTCNNLWYIADNNKIHCLPQETNACPNDYPYQIFKTKECIKPTERESKCSEEEHYVINLICYENSCPEFTKKKDENSKICICDETKGKWYKINDDNNGNIYYTCGLDECPPNKPNLLEDKQQCTFNCDEDGETLKIWAYRNLCYQQCPEFTKEDATQKACIFYELNKAENLEELNNYVSVQVKELYESGPRGGNIFNNFDSSLQIYPINKLGNSPAKDITMKSNLTYINLDNCLNKIFEDQNLDEDDNIFIVKYDLLNKKQEEPGNNNNGGSNDGNGNGGGDGGNNNNPNPNDNSGNRVIKNTENYLINEIEYEFYSSKTLQKIDASVCSSKEIIISYPITYTLAKFDNDESGFNLNEYRQKFNLGKELYHKDNTVDIFNFNNSIYKELCTPLEINGKDVVYEQRYDILYPNNVTLCEKNCTLYYTDYELGRINCKCDYKEILDFNREMPAISDLLNDPNFAKPTQSGANAEVIKCLSKLPNKDSIIKNEAFYISAVIIVGEISMICVAGFYGVKLIKSTIYNLGRKIINNNNNINITKNENKNDNIVVTSNRRLYNNPPKKNSMIVNDDTNNEQEKEKDKDNEKKPYNIIKKRILFNFNKNKQENENINKDKTSFDLDIKDIDSNSKNNNNEFIEVKDIKGKAEFIPPEYNFKFFKPSESGVIRKISRKEIPFKISPTTKYLLEQKSNINYSTNYLDGPIYANQNMIEIIEENANDKEENDLDKKIEYKNIKDDNINILLQSKRVKPKIKTITTEKSFINIKTIMPQKKINETDEDNIDDDNIEKKQKITESVSLYFLIKYEQAMLRTPYKIYNAKDHSNLLAIILAEIMDKIYLIKICCFLKPFELFSIHLFNYLIYHIILLTLLCAFFTIKTIKKIYTEGDFPKLNFYLLYGFISSVIIWIIYKLFSTLIDHRDKVNDLIKIRQELNKKENKENNINNIIDDNKTEKDDEINEELYELKYNELMKKIKMNMIIFFIIGMLITILCAIYLISFFAIYTGTKTRVIKAYYITLIEIVLIKFVYGLCLAALRKAGETNEIENVYKVPYFCNKYIS